MVNYDLPWNPNRIEQRFGRIHRIGQTEVCHLWNLVAEETREGDVYRTLLEKLEEARKALGGQVFDVLGKLQFEGKPLRELLIEAIRYGEQPEVRARLTTVVAHAFDRGQLRGSCWKNVLSPTTRWTPAGSSRIREDMERADATPPSAALYRVVFSRSLPTARRLGQAARTAPLRGDARSGAGAKPRSSDRRWRARASTVRTHCLRKVAGRAAGSAAGRLCLPGSSAARLVLDLRLSATAIC